MCPPTAVHTSSNQAHLPSPQSAWSSAVGKSTDAQGARMSQTAPNSPLRTREPSGWRVRSTPTELSGEANDKWPSSPLLLKTVTIRGCHSCFPASEGELCLPPQLPEKEHQRTQSWPPEDGGVPRPLCSHRERPVLTTVTHSKRGHCP